MTFSISDLHCDLLSYLEISSKRTAYDSVVHCSIPQLRAGNVGLQVMAVFTQTGPNSTVSAQKQIAIYKDFPTAYLSDFEYYNSSNNVDKSSRIRTLLAIENASGLWEENEPFTNGLMRFHSLIQSTAKPLYIGMTWHTENRFGGGNSSKIGLKEEGKLLLEELHGQHIAVDLSHTSDALADGILDYLEYKNLDVPILASHSNARTILDHPRNLPNTLAKEIFKRKGVIGLNFYKNFVGQNCDDFIKHVEHWLGIGGENHICLGADFFYEGDLTANSKIQIQPYFSEYDSAACYPYLLENLQKKLGLSDNQLEAIANGNAKKFINENVII